MAGFTESIVEEAALGASRGRGMGAMTPCGSIGSWASSGESATLEFKKSIAEGELAQRLQGFEPPVLPAIERVEVRGPRVAVREGAVVVTFDIPTPQKTTGTTTGKTTGRATGKTPGKTPGKTLGKAATSEEMSDETKKGGSWGVID